MNTLYKTILVSFFSTFLFSAVSFAGDMTTEALETTTEEVIESTTDEATDLVEAQVEELTEDASDAVEAVAE